MTQDTPSAVTAGLIREADQRWGEGAVTVSQPGPTPTDPARLDAAQPDVAASGAASATAAAVDASAVGGAAAGAAPTSQAPGEVNPSRTEGAGSAPAEGENQVSGVAAAPEPAQDVAAAAAPEPDEESLRLAEALVFASAGPVSARSLTQLLPDTADADTVIAALRARYAGRGVELVDTAGGVQFRTSADLAPRLRKVIEVPRKLPRVAMETLAIIAYHQPCTRAEIEEIRGTSLSQQTLDALLEANLVAPKGRREVPGRPTLWGTTVQFLAQFGLQDIRDLPQRTDLLLEMPQPTGVSDAPPLTSDLSPPPQAADSGPDGSGYQGASAQAAEPSASAAASNPATPPNPDSAPLSPG